MASRFCGARTLCPEGTDLQRRVEMARERSDMNRSAESDAALAAVRAEHRGHAAVCRAPKRLPRTLRRGHDDSIACAHRDLSVCPTCAAANGPELVDVYGQHYWVPNVAERAELLAGMKEGG